MDDVTIVIATFNSERTLRLVLNSIRAQTYPHNHIAILIVDGGSKDSTLEIAKEYSCQIILNPRVEPAHAKYLGYLNATSKYLIYLDHDEVFECNRSIEKKVALLADNANVKIAIGSGYKSPQGCSFINEYLNEFGDPFSFFIYHLSKDSRYFIKAMRNRYPVLKESDTYLIFDFAQNTKLPIIEHGAAGSMIDREHYEMRFKEFVKSVNDAYHFQSVYFYNLMDSENSYLGIVKDDALYHYSAENLSGYLRKVKWRIRNNVHHMDDVGIAGFLSREKFESNPIKKYLKYLFIPYAITILPALIDALYLVVSRKKLLYFVHVPLCAYTASLILYNYALKLFGLKPSLMSYDGKVKVPPQTGADCK